ncbi:hypothetical protein [Zhihengliuella sp.]|uniref:hypothetical protein n=1 Tax=Zhihengliuella sp. TaxID=1954483 RepID=UPI002811E663|nr:hypothetical protein [Zhihengliuella sp.]
MRQSLIVLTSFVAAFAVSFVADTYFGVPFWGRLIIVVCVSLLVATAVTKWSTARRRRADEFSSGA